MNIIELHGRWPETMRLLEEKDFPARQFQINNGVISYTFSIWRNYQLRMFTDKAELIVMEIPLETTAIGNGEISMGNLIGTLDFTNDANLKRYLWGLVFVVLDVEKINKLLRF